MLTLSTERAAPCTTSRDLFYDVVGALSYACTSPSAMATLSMRTSASPPIINHDLWLMIAFDDGEWWRKRRSIVDWAHQDFGVEELVLAVALEAKLIWCFGEVCALVKNGEKAAAQRLYWQVRMTDLAHLVVPALYLEFGAYVARVVCDASSAFTFGLPAAPTSLPSTTPEPHPRRPPSLVAPSSAAATRISESKHRSLVYMGQHGSRR